MPLLQHFCQLLYDSHFGTAIRESDNAFPIIESVHVLGITLLVGTIALLDLRMLGLILRPISVTRIARAVFPLTWSGFAVMFASGFLLFSTVVSNPLFAMLSIAIASFSNDLVMPGAWGAAMDVGGVHAGSLSGAMNMSGNIGGALCPLAIGYILTWSNNNWNLTFYLSAAIYLMGTVCWKFLDPVTPLEAAGAD